MLSTVRAARPDMLTATGDEDNVELENRVMARMLSVGLAAVGQRVAQRDPGKLSDATRPVTFPDGTQADLSPLQRWERLLRLTPAPGATLTARRAAVRSAVVSTSSASRVAVEEAMAGVFGAWFLGLGENSVEEIDYPGRVPVGNVTAFWPVLRDPALPDLLHAAVYPGRYSLEYFWTSGLCHIAVLIQPPASTDQARVNVARDKALQVLDDMLPAWMSATVSQLAPGQSGSGFFLGVSYLGLTAL
jgi:hypothetical protein